MKVKIIYITTTRLPTEKAHGLATMKLAEAFAHHGIELEIISPWRFNPIKQDPFDYYGVARNFRLIKVPSIDLFSLKIFPGFLFYLNLFSFVLFAFCYLLLSKRFQLGRYIFFSHDHVPLYFMSLLGVQVFYDIHDFPTNTFFYRRVLKKSLGLAVQTRWKIEELKRVFGVADEKIVYWPNGTDVDFFGLAVSKDEARKKLNLPLDKKLIIYTGHLFGWKGVETLARATALLSSDIWVYIVGGTDNDRRAFQDFVNKKKLPRITLIPFQSRNLVLFWLKAADVLVLPNTARENISKFYTSPMKMFEYMAVGRPIVASRIPSITEILNDKNSFLFEPDNEMSLAKAAEEILNEPNKAAARVEQALIDVRHFTWEDRAEKIINLMEKRLNTP